MSESAIPTTDTEPAGDPQSMGPGRTVGDQVNLLLAYLRHNYSSSTLSSESKIAPLYDDLNMDMLMQLSRRDSIAFNQVVNDIDGITGLGVKALKDAVNKRAASGRDASVNEDVQTAAVPSQNDIEAARKILLHGDPIRAHVEYAVKVRKVHGGDKAARVITMSAYSCYLPANDRLHLDVAGSSQIGKSRTVTTVLETFPEENVMVLTEASPKSIYYFAEKSPERLKNLTIYLDDAREEHVPVLKTFRNEGNVTPSNLTVGDNKESALQQVPHRPVIIDSSVNPVHDFERQAPSRAFLVSIPDTTPEQEKEVRKAIRLMNRAEAIVSKKSDAQRDILRAMALVLREEGVKGVLVPFDPIEPDDADRRGTGHFMKLIKISAFINQYQRPILELSDGRKFVLAVYEDLAIAATVWFDYAAGQELKISPKAIEVLRILPIEYPGKTASILAEVSGK